MTRRKKSKQRTLAFEGADRQETLSRVTAVDLESSDQEFIYFDKQSDGTWSMAYTKRTFSDIESFQGLKILPKAEDEQ